MQKTHFSNPRKIKMNDRIQSGNAVVFVLLALVLFGALIFTFTNSGQQSISRMSKNEVRIAAQEAIFYAQHLEKAVQRVRSNGCSENQISFNYDSDGDGNYIDSGDTYNNTSAPADFSCHIFRSEGGKASPENLGGQRIIAANYHCVRGMQSSCNGTTTSGVDLIHYNRFGDSDEAKQICDQVNLIVGSREKGQSTPLENISFSFSSSIYFQGSFAASTSTIATRLEGAGIDDQETSCVEDNAGNPGGYIMYSVLLAR